MIENIGDLTINNNSDTCLVFFHGYSETPMEYIEFSERFSDLDIDIFIPLLPHHGVDFIELSKANAQDIYNWGTKIVEDLGKRYNKIFVSGHSLGAGIAYICASNSLDTNGIIMIGPNAYPSIHIRFFSKLNHLFPIKTIRAFHTDLKKSAYISKEYLKWKKNNFPRLPIGLFIEAMDSLPEYRLDATNIDVPVLIIHGARDFNTNVKKTQDFYFNKIKSKIKIFIIVKKTGHAVLISNKMDKIVDEIKKFIKIVDKNEIQAISERKDI